MATLVQLADIRPFLRMRSTADDPELQAMLDDAVAAVADLVGPLTPVTVIDEIDDHGYRIALPQTPVQSVTTVSVEPWLGATPIDDTANWRLNVRTGVIRRKLVGGALPFLGPGSVFTVTYVAGWSDIPLPVNRAILMQVRHMWKTQRGAMSPGPNTMDDALPGFPGQHGFLAPDVMDLLFPYLTPPGVA